MSTTTRSPTWRSVSVVRWASARSVSRNRTPIRYWGVSSATEAAVAAGSIGSVMSGGLSSESAKQHFHAEPGRHTALEREPRFAAIAERAQHLIERARAARLRGRGAEDGQARGAAGQPAEQITVPEPTRLDEGLRGRPVPTDLIAQTQDRLDALLTRLGQQPQAAGMRLAADVGKQRRDALDEPGAEAHHLATGEHGRGQPADLGKHQDDHGPRWRLLERLQERLRRRGGHLLRLVHDEHLPGRLGGPERRPALQLADCLDAQGRRGP